MKLGDCEACFGTGHKKGNPDPEPFGRARVIVKARPCEVCRGTGWSFYATRIPLPEDDEEDEAPPPGYADPHWSRS